MSDKTKDQPRRILTSLQSTGRIGQSTLKQGFISWFGWAGINFSAVDGDGPHRTLSSWYPKFTTWMPYEKEDDLLAILNVPIQGPVHLIDFPSMHTESILRAFEHLNALAELAAKNVRVTVCVFASDERAALISAHQIITAFEQNVDYVIIQNPARFTSKIWDNSAPAGLLRKLDAPTVTIPRITGITIDTLDAASKRAKKFLTFREAEEHLEQGSKWELQNWRNRLFAQFEDIAHVLIPSADLIQAKVTRPKQKKLVAVDPFDL
jgi:hypothetical protein